MPGYRRFDPDGRAVFVTVVTHGRQPLLARDAERELLLEAMRRVKRIHPFRHLAHVVLPDHFHWLFVPARATMSAVVGAVKRDLSWRLKEQAGRVPPFWQQRFYDHIIRDEKDFERHLHYIHFNPVKHGVTDSVAAYRHSSFQAWVQRGVYAPDWGRAEPAEITRLDLE